MTMDPAIYLECSLNVALHHRYSSRHRLYDITMITMCFCYLYLC